MLLSATLGTSLDIEAAGRDEHEAVQAVEEFFADLNPVEDSAIEGRSGN